MLLDAALANMFQGLAMFDADERLVIANNRFAEMYGLTSEDVVPGTRCAASWSSAQRTGSTRDETAERQLEVMRQHFARRKVTHLAERLSDGRAILVSIRPRPGGGWVTTHQDVTERENLNAELAQQNELLREREDELRQQKEQLDVALNNMSQGVAMFDAEQRLVVCNKLYARDVRPDRRPGGARHAPAADRGAAGRRRLLLRRERRRAAELDAPPPRPERRAPHHVSELKRRPLHCRVGAADAGRRHRHHAPGHHRAALRRGQDRAHGAARHADRASQPRAPQRAPGAGPHARAGAARSWPSTCSISTTSRR